MTQMCSLLMVVATLAFTQQGSAPDIASRRGQTIVDSGPWRQLLSKHNLATMTEQKVMMPMGDGVHLAADIVRPKAEGRFPSS